MASTPSPVAKYRIERDPLGEVRVPADAYYGGQTQRAVENFPISGLTAPPELVTATIQVKKAAAEANRDLRRLDEDVARAIVSAADEVLDGQTSRSIRRRRVSGWGRDLAQHERERGPRQPCRGVAGRNEGRLLARSSQRSRQHGAVHQRRLPHRHAARRSRHAPRLDRSRARSGKRARRQESGVRRRSSRPDAPICRTPCR